MMILGLLSKIASLGFGVYGLFVLGCLAIVSEIGFRIGKFHSASADFVEKDFSSVSTLTAGMLGLMAFILAMNINFAQSRFEARRETVVVEANTIGTAWLRAGLAGGPGQPVAVLIEDYAHARLDYSEATAPTGVASALARTSLLQAQIWQQALSITNDMPAPLAALLISSLNDMFDANLSQRYAVESRVPTDTLLLLMAGSMLTVGALGFQIGLAGRRQFTLSAILLIMLSGGMMTIVDFNRPDIGAQQVDTEPLIWTIEGMVPATSP